MALLCFWSFWCFFFVSVFLFCFYFRTLCPFMCVQVLEIIMSMLTWIFSYVYYNITSTAIYSHVVHVKAEVMPVNEHGALMYAGRWGIHGVSLPGRVTFSPGNVGWVTFGAPRPQQVHSVLEIRTSLRSGPSH